DRLRRVMGMVTFGSRGGKTARFLFILSSSHLVTLSLFFLHSPVTRGGEAPLFEPHTADRINAPGQVVDVREDWSVSLTGTKALRVDGKDLVELRQSETLLPPTPRGEHVVFTYGDQLPGAPQVLSGERIRFTAHVGTDQELML